MFDQVSFNKIVDEIDKLSRQIVKYRYVKNFYNIDIIEPELYNYKLERLKKIENINSNLKPYYSPSDRVNFDLQDAQRIFGVDHWKRIEIMFKVMFNLNSDIN